MEKVDGKMEDYKVETIDKIIRMFRPRDRDFGPYKADEVICGPNDRALFGFDTNFPIDWLVEDYDFTKEEAEWFISKVNELYETNS